MATNPVLKNVYITYQSKNLITTLSDVYAQVYLNGVPKAVGSSKVLLSVLDSTNAPGIYLLTLTAAMLTSYGVSASQVNDLEIIINSATAPAEAFAREQITVATSDDIANLIGTPASTSVSADIANLSTQIAALSNGQSSKIGGLPPVVLIPSTGSNTYQAQFLNFNGSGVPTNITGNLTAGLLNASGTSRSTYLASTTFSNPSAGVYTVVITIPNGAPEEQLILSASGTISGSTETYYYNFIAETDINAAGLAQQSTLLSVQSTAQSTNSIVSNGTYGNAQLAANQATMASTLSAIEGSGFSTSTQSLAAIQTQLTAVQTFLTNNVYTGGKAI